MKPGLIDDILDDLTVKIRQNALDTAAKVAELYGAPAEAIEAILRLKNPPPPTLGRSEQSQ